MPGTVEEYIAEFGVDLGAVFHFFVVGASRVGDESFSVESYREIRMLLDRDVAGGLVLLIQPLGAELNSCLGAVPATAAWGSAQDDPDGPDQFDVILKAGVRVLGSLGSGEFVRFVRILLIFGDAHGRISDHGELSLRTWVLKLGDDDENVLRLYDFREIMRGARGEPAEWARPRSVFMATGFSCGANALFDEVAGILESDLQLHGGHWFGFGASKRDARALVLTTLICPCEQGRRLVPLRSVHIHGTPAWRELIAAVERGSPLLSIERLVESLNAVPSRDPAAYEACLTRTAAGIVPYGHFYGFGGRMAPASEHPRDTVDLSSPWGLLKFVPGAEVTPAMIAEAQKYWGDRPRGKDQGKISMIRTICGRLNLDIDTEEWASTLVGLTADADCDAMAMRLLPRFSRWGYEAMWLPVVLATAAKLLGVTLAELEEKILRQDS